MKEATDGTNPLPQSTKNWKKPWLSEERSNKMIPLFSVILLFGFAAALMNLPVTRDWRTEYVSKSTFEKMWQIRSEFKKNGKLLFRVTSDPGLSAGKPFKYNIQFTNAMTKSSDKVMSIVATHKDTGTKVVALPKQEFNSDGIEQPLTFNAGLPLSGLWKYDIELDGVVIGDVVMEVQEPSWELSSTFNTGTFRMRGTEGRIGIMEAGFRGGRNNRYLWHFWGSEQELGGTFKLMAVQRESRELKELISSAQLNNGVNGADRMLLTSLTLPSSGRWQLMAYINERLFDSIIVEVR
jgi:hypothetical protein